MSLPSSSSLRDKFCTRGDLLLGQDFGFPEAIKTFIKAKADEFVLLAGTSPEQAQTLAYNLYSQLQELVVSPEWVQTVHSIKAMADVKMVAGIEMVHIAKVRCESMYGQVKESVSASRPVDYLASAVQTATTIGEQNYLAKAVMNAAQTSQSQMSLLLEKLPAATEIRPTEVYEHVKSQWQKLYAKAANRSLGGIELAKNQFDERILQVQEIKASVESRCETLYSNLAQQVACSSTYPTQLLQSAQAHWAACEESAKQRLYGVANKGFSAVSKQLLGAVKAAPYGEVALSQLGNGLSRTPIWALLPSKVTALFPPTPVTKEAVLCSSPCSSPEKELDDDILFTEEPFSPTEPLMASELTSTNQELLADELQQKPLVVASPEKELDDAILISKSILEAPDSPRDPLAESSMSAEADQEALYAQGEKYFDLCDKNGDGSLTKSEIKNFAKKPAGMLLKQLFANSTMGWADLWNLIEMSEDSTFSKDSFASAYAQLTYSA